MLALPTVTVLRPTASFLLPSITVNVLPLTLSTIPTCSGHPSFLSQSYIIKSPTLGVIAPFSSQIPISLAFSIALPQEHSSGHKFASPTLINKAEINTIHQLSFDLTL